jgi:hypothetical protein
MRQLRDEQGDSQSRYYFFVTFVFSFLSHFLTVNPLRAIVEAQSKMLGRPMPALTKKPDVASPQASSSASTSKKTTATSVHISDENKRRLRLENERKRGSTDSTIGEKRRKLDHKKPEKITNTPKVQVSHQRMALTNIDDLSPAELRAHIANFQRKLASMQQRPSNLVYG